MIVSANARVSPGAIVHEDARLAENVEIGPFSIVHAGVDIGAGSRIDAYCELGVPSPLACGATLKIGAGSTIRSHSVFYAGSQFGDELETGHHVTVREHTQAGPGLRLGTLADVQGDCTFGEYVRLHSGVFVAKGSRIGHFVWLMPYVMLTNDPTPPSNVRIGCVIDDYAVVAARAVIMPGVRIGTHALVAAGACVTHDVAEGMLVAGVPARLIGRADRVRLRDAPDHAAYPWTNHFTRGYPAEARSRWPHPPQREY
ncbi:acyltransferase [Methylibium sp.]|uniref:acyltransferase n=1 Tax=Methylibium sp. TaxID=2067992 RepID=UPI003D149CC1